MSEPVAMLLAGAVVSLALAWVARTQTRIDKANEDRQGDTTKALTELRAHFDAELAPIKNSVQTILLDNRTFDIRIRNVEGDVAVLKGWRTSVDDATRDFWKQHGHRFRDEHHP